MKHLKKFNNFNEGFSRIAAALFDRKGRKDHENEYKNDPTCTNAADCVGTLDWEKVPVSDKISSDILSKIKSGVYNIEKYYDWEREGMGISFTFKLKELPNSWKVMKCPTDSNAIYVLEKDGKTIEKTTSSSYGAPMLVELYYFINKLPIKGDQLSLKFEGKQNSQRKSKKVR